MRFSKQTQLEAQQLITIMQNYGVQAFLPSKLGICDRERLHTLIRLSKSHHTLQERFCSEEMSPVTLKRCETKRANLEKRICAIAQHFQLTATFSGDPRRLHR